MDRTNLTLRKMIRRSFSNSMVNGFEKFTLTSAMKIGREKPSHLWWLFLLCAQRCTFLTDESPESAR